MFCYFESVLDKREYHFDVHGEVYNKIEEWEAIPIEFTLKASDLRKNLMADKINDSMNAIRDIHSKKNSTWVSTHEKREG